MARSKTERMWLVGGGLSALILLLIGYLFFISPQRSATDDVHAQADAAQLQNSKLESRISTLRAQNANLPKYQAELATARLALPSTSGLPDFLRTLQSIGNATLTDVTSITVGPPVDVSTVAGAAPAAPGAAPATSTPSASVTTAPSGTATPGSVVTAGPHVYGLSITAQVTGSPTTLNRFLTQLQSVQPRAVLLTEITEASGQLGAPGAATGADSTTLQLTMQAFVAPVDAAESADLASASHK
jgi:type IV pilus assembly protein PilO